MAMSSITGGVFLTLTILCFVHPLIISAQTPIEEGLYLIRSNVDSAYAVPSDSGDQCGSLGRVYGNYRSPPFPQEYKWNLTIDSMTGYANLQSLGETSGQKVNSITYEDDSAPCELVERNLRIIPDRGYYEVVSVSTGKCLNNYGSEVGILFWLDCGGVGQHWIFDPTS